MNYGLMRQRAQRRKDEDRRDVDFIKTTFKDEGYTPERLALCLKQAETYERQSGSRANRNVIEALKQLQREQELPLNK